MQSVRQTRNVVPIPILTYHQIAPAPEKGTPYRSMCVAPEDFARQMGLLAILGYRGLSMTGLQPYLAGERTGKVVGITLDDGYLNNLTHAAPVLQRHGFSATCYVVSQMLGATNVWDREAGIPASSLMSAEQLRQWVACGQEVGAHTRHHVRLGQSEPKHAAAEIGLCKAELQNLLELPVNHFCYPYGDYSSAHVSMASTAGYETATTTQRGRCHSGTSFLELPRVPVLRTTTRLVLLLKLFTAYEDRRST